jgi:hypothetical protein
LIAGKKWELAQEFIDAGLDHRPASDLPMLPGYVKDIYIGIKDKELSDICIDTLNKHALRNNGWPSALYFSAMNKYLAREHELLLRLFRVNNHSISGPVIRMVRKMKNDPTFGDFEDVSPR